jgi:UDP-N-acetylglucosamine--N-acetylmuramyl-(pentapeptide) pyrophosphoryl-undecaprenol N-acetylglucosamine transferase
LLVAFYAAWLILKKEEPDLIVSAGGYTAVPMIICGWWQRIPALIHQQDARPLLSNKLSAPFAAVVTLAWPNLRKNFPKGHLLGNPVRSAFLRAKKDEGLKHFSLNENKPTVLVLGGGSGSLWLNRTVAEIIDQLLLQANLIHLTGKGKGIEGKGAADFRSFEFLTKEMPLAFAAADLVVCRAGMATITELAATKKAAIIVPLPNSPQEDNAAAINGAAVLLKQNQTTPAFLLEEIVRLLGDPRRRSEMGEALNKLLKTEVADDLVIIGQKIIAKNLKIGVDCC